MALLKIGKAKENNTQAAVPDELPNLPELKKEEAKPAAAPEEKKVEVAVQQPVAAAQATAPIAEKQELAPDELPPIVKKEEIAAKPAIETKTEAAKMETKTDDRLYFSKLIARFHDESMRHSAEAEIATATSEVVSQLNQQWEEQKHAENLAQINSEIMKRLEPMQALEKEWRAAKEEAYEKAKKAREIEQLIEKSTTELKVLIEEKKRIESSKNK